VQISWYSALRS